MVAVIYLWNVQEEEARVAKDNAEIEKRGGGKKSASKKKSPKKSPEKKSPKKSPGKKSTKVKRSAVGGGEVWKLLLLLLGSV